MNYTRIAIAGIVAAIVDVIYGFPVYGVMMASEFGRYPGVFRGDDAARSHMPLGFLCILGAMWTVAIIYAKGYEGGSGFAEGGRFGVLMGIFVAFAFVGVNYAILNIGRRLAAEMWCAAIVEWTIVGFVIGLVYKPRAGSVQRSA
jgi:hypothetical protein